MSQADPNAELSPAALKRGLDVLLVGTFLMWAGFFMAIPLISVHYVDGLGWSASSVGLVLAVRQSMQHGLTFFGGMLADRLGARGLILVGLLIRALGFALLAVADTYALLMASGILSAIGGSFFEAPRLAAIAAMTTESNRSRYYALAGVVGSIGMTIGPLVGVWLNNFSFSAVGWVSASFFIVSLALVAWLLPDVKVAVGGQRITYGIGLVMRDHTYLLYALLMMGFWFMWTQINMSLLLQAVDLSQRKEAVSWVLAVNALTVVLLQFPLLRLLERRMNPSRMLISGMVLMLLGLGAVVLAKSIVWMLICVWVFSLGLVLAAPAQQTVAANLSDSRALGSYYGVNGLSIAIGGGIGSYMGGVIYDLGQTWGFSGLPWICFAGVGLVSVVGLTALKGRIDQVKTASS